MTLLFIAGLASAQTGSLSSSLTYENPLKTIPKAGLKITGQSANITCGVLECSYVFQVKNESGLDLYDLSIKPYLTSAENSFKIVELVNETYFVPETYCNTTSQQNIIDLNNPLNPKIIGKRTVCIDWQTRQISLEKIVEKPVSVAGRKASAILDSKSFVLSNQALTSITSGNERVFKITFKPSKKQGELAIIAQSISNESIKGSLDPWWNVVWLYRKLITITAGSTVRIDINSTLIATLDTYSLILAGKMQTDCDDLRIVYADNTELDRDIIDCRSPNTQVKFKPKAIIENSTTDNTNYYLYYGNTVATNDKNNIANVYEYAESWETYTIGLNPPDANWTSLYTFQDFVDANYAYHGMKSLRILDSSDQGARTAGDNNSDGNRTASSWVKWTNSIPASNEVYMQFYGTPATYKRLSIQDNNTFAYNGSTQASCGTATNAWYRFDITYDKPSGKTIWEVYGADLNVKCSGTSADSAGIDMNGIRLTGGNNNTAYFDKISIEKRTGNSTISVGTEEIEGGVNADFNYTTPAVLDIENGVTSVSSILTDLSTVNGATTSIISWSWDKNGTTFSTDQNTIASFTAAGDYNITLGVTGDDNSYSQISNVLSVFSVVQGLDFDLNTSSVTSTDANITGTFNVSIASGSAEHYYWQSNGDYTGSDSSSLTQTFNSFGDKNVCVTVQSGDVNKLKCKVFQVTRVIVKRPKDEITQEVLTPFTVSIDTNASSTYTDINNDTNVFFLTPSIISKNIIIDKNSEYFRRYYSILTNGSLYTLQPYLLKTSNSASIAFYVKEYTTGASLSNTKITVKKYILGSLTIVEEQTSDSAGIATFSMNYNDTYYIDANYQGYGFAGFELRPVQTSYTLKINVYGTRGGSVSKYTFWAVYNPAGSTITQPTILNYITVDVNAYSNGNFISWLRLRIMQDTNVFVDVNTSNGGIPFGAYQSGFKTINIGGLNNGAILFIIDLNDVNGNYKTLQHTLSYVKTGSIDINVNIAGLKDSLGDRGSLILAIFLTLIIAGLAIYAGGYQAGSLVGGACLIVFGVLGWIPMPVAIIAAIFGFAMYYLRSGL